jgi:hypothetical protein
MTNNAPPPAPSRHYRVDLAAHCVAHGLTQGEASVLLALLLSAPDPWADDVRAVLAAGDVARVTSLTVSTVRP